MQYTAIFTAVNATYFKRKMYLLSLVIALNIDCGAR